MNVWAVTSVCQWRRAVRLTVAVVAAVIILARCDSTFAERALGLDISAWQGSISQTAWNNFRNIENRQFVFLRASRGGTTGYYNQNDPQNASRRNTLSQRYDDPYFVQNINRATAAGMFAGSYHFSRPDIVDLTLNANGIPNSGADEADHFIQMAGAWMRPGYLLPVHDFEAGDGIRSDNDMARFCIDFSDRIYQVMGIRPAIYLNGNYAHNILGGATTTLRNQVVAAHPTLWSARWPNQGNPNAIDVQNGHPKDSFTNIYGPWDDSGTTHPWAFWQYASTGRLQSFNNGGSNLDFDVARGEVEFLKDHLVPALWMNDSSGDWSTLLNWNSGQPPVDPVPGAGQVPPVGTQTLPTPRLPGAAGTGITAGRNDTVILDRPYANITVTHSSGVHNVRKLFVREAFEMTGGSLTVNYVPSADSTPIAAQFSAPVALHDGASLSVHALQVDAGQALTLHGGTLAFNSIQLMPGSTIPAKIAVNGDVTFTPLANTTATIANAAGPGNAGVVDLGGGDRRFHVVDGTASVDFAVDVPIVNGGLTKDGGGTLALQAANSYAGTTTLRAGTLSIATASLTDSADVFLSAGTRLNLDFSGSPDTIDSLFIDGVSQPAGTWGAVGSGAHFTSALLTGTGLLHVTTFAASPLPGDYDVDGAISAADYNTWRTTYGQTVAAGTGADGNRNGLIDAADYAIWRRHLAQSSLEEFDASTTSIPEPASACLLLAGCGAAYFLIAAFRTFTRE